MTVSTAPIHLRRYAEIARVLIKHCRSDLAAPELAAWLHAGWLPLSSAPTASRAHSAAGYRNIGWLRAIAQRFLKIGSSTDVSPAPDAHHRTCWLDAQARRHTRRAG